VESSSQFIATKIVIDIATGRVLEREGFFYSGPIAQLKKGREQADAAAKGGVALGKQGSQIATQDQGIQQGYRSAGDTAAKTYFATPTDPSGLNQFNRSQYELDKSNIARTAQDSISVGQRMLASRGFQGSPGAMSSLINTTNRNADASTNDAYVRALQNQQQLGLAGIGYNQQQQQMYNPLSAIGAASSAYGQGGNSAAQRGQMGSWGSDIVGGIGTLAGAAGSVMTGLGNMNRRS
jgi:hypothetical protein